MVSMWLTQLPLSWWWAMGRPDCAVLPLVVKCGGGGHKEGIVLSWWAGELPQGHHQIAPCLESTDFITGGRRRKEVFAVTINFSKGEQLHSALASSPANSNSHRPAHQPFHPSSWITLEAWSSVGCWNLTRLTVAEYTHVPSLGTGSHPAERDRPPQLGIHSGPAGAVAGGCKSIHVYQLQSYRPVC